MADIPSKPQVSTVAWINGQTRLNHNNLTAGVNTNLLNIKTAVDGIIDVLGEGVESAPMKEVTYSELKALRDGGQLIPGQQYRITDYDTKIDPEWGEISAAHHPFDIIVTADTATELNEHARACRREGDEYFGRDFIYQSNVEIAYTLDEGTEEVAYEGDGTRHDTIMEGEYLDGVPVLYKTDTKVYGNKVDYADRFDYIGDFELNGVTYNEWKKINVGGAPEETGYLILTNVIVVNNQFVEEVTAEKTATAYSPSLWKLWYSLDNDSERFEWAYDEGTGVIYRMIDEYGNDCPYDFKNIMFERKVEDGRYAPDSESATTKDFYTFSFLRADGTVVDASISGNNGELVDDESYVSGVYENVIKPRHSSTSYIDARQTLNNIVFLSSYAHDSGYFYGYHGNTFNNNCERNTFGNDCHNNVFQDGCYDNVLGDACSDNVFGARCNNNNFGDSCTNNYFGDNCYRNKIGDFCSYNTLGEDCNGNIFGNRCYYNVFNKQCYSNIFGSSENTINDFYQYVKLDAGCSYLCIVSADTSASFSNYLQNVHIHYGVKGIGAYDDRLTVSIPDRNLPYETDVYLDVNGNLIYKENNNDVGLRYSAVAPTSDNNDGDIKLVVLTSEPATKYKNYLYLIVDIAFSVTDQQDVTVTYSAAGGMTWAQWIDSDYNVNNFTVSDGYIRPSSGTILQYNGITVDPTDQIVENGEYNAVAG